MDGNVFLEFLHSLLRYGVLLTVGGAGLLALRGRLFARPILTWERTVTIVAVMLCHVQLLLGLLLYALRFKALHKIYPPGSAHLRFWKFEHIGTMIIAIALVTIGRAMAKRAREEQRKQVLVAVFFLIAFALMWWATPWPFTAMGFSRGWL